MSNGAVSFTFDPEEGISDFLTPVYFDRRVLVKYLYDSRFDCTFGSETYGWVNTTDWDIAFGINVNKAVFAWLGDLLKLPLTEQFHWQSENLPPQGETRSEFFEAQIHAQFTPPPLAIQTLNALTEWDGAFARKYGCSLYKARSLDDRLEDVRRYRQLLINREDDFVAYVSELNEIINESVDTEEARKLLRSKSVQFEKGLKGNKLLEKVYVDFLGDKKNLIAPFFYLYDLRLWADHNMGDGKLLEVAAALGVADPRDYDVLMVALLTRLERSATDLLAQFG